MSQKTVKLTVFPKIFFEKTKIKTSENCPIKNCKTDAHQVSYIHNVIIYVICIKTDRKTCTQEVGDDLSDCMLNFLPEASTLSHKSCGSGEIIFSNSHVTSRWSRDLRAIWL